MKVKRFALSGVRLITVGTVKCVAMVSHRDLMKEHVSQLTCPVEYRMIGI